jgi:hypothetical protein
MMHWTFRFAAITLGAAVGALPAVAAAQVDMQAAEQAGINGAIETFEQVCHFLVSQPEARPANVEALRTWLSERGLTENLPDALQSRIRMSSPLFSNSVLFHRPVGAHFVVLQLRGDGTCRTYLMGPDSTRERMRAAISEAIGASSLGWATSGPAVPGPGGVTGQVYRMTTPDGREFGMFAIDGGPLGSPIQAAFGREDLTRARAPR